MGKKAVENSRKTSKCVLNRAKSVKPVLLAKKVKYAKHMPNMHSVCSPLPDSDPLLLPRHCQRRIKKIIIIIKLLLGLGAAEGEDTCENVNNSNNPDKPETFLGETRLKLLHF